MLSASERTCRCEVPVAISIASAMLDLSMMSMATMSTPFISLERRDRHRRHRLAVEFRNTPSSAGRGYARGLRGFRPVT